MSQPVTTTSTVLAEPASAALAPVGQTASGNIALFDDRMFARVVQIGEMMAKGSCTIPTHLRGNPADCTAIVGQAMRWGMDPWAVAQKTHLVSGTLGYEAQLIVAVINSLAPLQDRLNYEWFGDWSKILGKFSKRTSQKGNEFQVPAWKDEDEDGLSVKVWATLKGEAQPRVLELMLRQATVRNSTLWAQDPRQQLAYLAAKRWSRLYCPDVILGVYSPDELSEFGPENARDVTPPKSVAGKLDAFGSAPAATASGPAIEGDAKPAAPKSEKTAKTFRLVTPDGEVKEWGKAGDWLADFRSYLGAASDPETYWDNNMDTFAELQAATSKNEQAAAAFREGYAEVQAAIAAHGSPDL